MRAQRETQLTEQLTWMRGPGSSSPAQVERRRDQLLREYRADPERAERIRQVAEDEIARKRAQVRVTEEAQAKRNREREMPRIRA